MDFLSNLDNNSILLIPNNIKDKVLDYIDNHNLLLNIKLMTFNELLDGLYYSYTSEAIFDVMNTEKVTYETAKDFIENTYYVDDNPDNNTKINNILTIKNRLDNKGLLIRDSLFINLLQSKNKLYVYGFTTYNKLNMHLLDKVSNYIYVEYIKYEEHDYRHIAHQFKTLEDEIIFVAENIAKLITEGKDINKIYLANYSDEYYFAINKIFGLYGIPVYLKGQTKLSDTTIAKYFFDNLSNNMDELLNDIKIKYDVENNNYNNKIYNKLFNLINTYSWTTDYVSIKDLIISEMKNININPDHFEKEIKTINITDNIFLDDEYIFLLGFNQKSIPKTYRDEDYLDDSINLCKKESSLEQNKGSKIRYIKAIKNINSNNLFITLKEISLKDKYLPSTLIDGDNITLVEEDVSYSSYSSNYNELLYANRIDDLIKFNDESDDLKELHSNYDIPYNTYNNVFTGIEANKLLKRIEEKGFSYSSVSTYFKCPFRFYLDFFHKLNEYETTFDSFIGSAFHKVLEECLKDNTKDIDEVYNQFIQDNKDTLEFNDKEIYFTNKLKDELKFIVDNIRIQMESTPMNITDIWYEKYLSFTTDELGIDSTIKTTVNGIVDKCIFINDDVIIVDYKTGNSATIQRDYFEYGITIQLPIYLYLLKNMNKNLNIVGMYLQHILSGMIRKEGKKSEEEIKTGRLKLDGITLDDEVKINEFFPDYKLLTGVQKTKDGEWKYPSRIMTYDEQDDIYNLIKELFTGCINNTCAAKFDIHPIQDDKVNGCDYCNYRDICYRRQENINYISKEGDQHE